MSSADSAGNISRHRKLGELTGNIRTFALPFENQTYTFKMNFEYDPFNRIQSILYPDSERVEYRYNLGGMLKKVTGSVTRKITDLVVVAPMQNTSLLQGGNEIQGGDIAPGIIPDPGPIEIQTVTLRYPYLDSIVYNKFELKDSVIYGNGTRVRYVYDSLQRLTALRSYTADDELMQDIAYHYDSVGNILDIENSASTLGNGLGGAYRQEYTYDGLYRLTRATGWWDCHPDHLTLYDTVDMRYSKNGRIISKRMSAETLKNMQLNLVRYDRQYQYPSGHANRVNSVTDALSGTSHQFEWESGGNLMRHVNPDQHYDRRLWWTEDNRLQTVADRDFFSYYQYDAGGERTCKLTWSGNWSSINGTGTVYYLPEGATLYASPYLVITPQGYTKHYYAETERITSQLGKGQFADVGTPVVIDSLVQVKLQAVTGNVEYPSTLTVPGSGVFAYLDTLTNQQNATSTLYFYHPDHLGSSSWITDRVGAAVQHLHYLPWGEDYVDQRTTNWSALHTFSAKERDSETGLSYFGSRYYSSDLSIWLSVDPMSDKYPSLSPYVYCADNPVKLVDPNGDTIRFNTEADRTFVLPLLNKNGKSYSPEFETIYNKLNESDHTYTFSLTHDNGKEEGYFENVDANCSIIHYSANTYSEHYGASKYRNLFEETYHAYQYDRTRKVINSCFSEAMAWKFSSLAPGTTYVNSKLGYTVMARCRDLPAWQLAFELKFGMLQNETYCGTEREWGEGRYHEFPLAVPEERIFFPLPVLFLTK